MSRVIKKKQALSKVMDDSNTAKRNIETIVIFFTVFIIVIHVLSCVWYLIGSLQIETDNWMFHKGYIKETTSKLYLLSFYFITTTLTTIGYGDILPTTRLETAFSLLLMILGILIQSVVVGALTILTLSINHKNARLKEWLLYLDEIKVKYNLNYEFYLKLRNAIVIENEKSNIDKVNFLKMLPKTLRNEISYFMYSSLKDKFSFFQKKSKRFIADIGPLLRHQEVQANDYIYLENDNAEDIYFILSGQASLVLPKYKNLKFISIEQGNYFGDTDLQSSKEDTFKRMHTAIADTDCKLLLLNINDFYKECAGYANYVDEFTKKGEARLLKINAIKDKAVQDLIISHSDVFDKGNNMKKLKTKYINVNAKVDHTNVAINSGKLKSIDEEISYCQECSFFKEVAECKSPEAVNIIEPEKEKEVEVHNTSSLACEDELEKLLKEMEDIEKQLSNAEKLIEGTIITS